MKRFILFLAALAICNSVIGQKVKDEDLTFKYKRLPSKAINKKITSYTGKVVLAYEEEEKKKIENYEKKKSEADQKYAQDKKAADEKYQKDKQEYKNESFGKKFADKALGQDNRPKQEYASKETVEKPYVRKTFDKSLLASTYIKLEGFEKANNANLIVTFIAFGLERLEPKVNEGSSTALSGPTSGQSQKIYTTEIKYRSPVAVKVETSDGTIILNETVEKTNEYKTWTSSSFQNEYQAKNIDPNQAVSQFEQKVLEENMKIANEYLNDNCASSTMERKIKLYNVESKKVDYSDFQQAFLAATEGYTLLLENKNEAKQKLQSAIDIWDKAMKESNPKDKKAKINEEVTIATVFNLAEAYMWCDKYTEAKLTTAKSSILDLSRRETKRIEELKELIDDQKKRFEANK